MCQVGQLTPQRFSSRRDAQQLLSVIDSVGHLLDELFTHQCADDRAQRCAFDLEDALQLALPGRPRVHQLVEHVPLGRSDAMLSEQSFHGRARGEIAPFRPRADRVMAVRYRFVCHQTIIVWWQTICQGVPTGVDFGRRQT